jgi:hypothetical protein
VQNLDEIASCLDVTDEHIREALSAARSLSDQSPREKSIALLRRMVTVAKPGTGAPRMLVLLARMSKRDWIEGDLIVRMIGDSELSVLELFVDDGMSRERIAGPWRIDVPLVEFAAAAEKNAGQILPLLATERSSRRLELRGTRDQRAQQRKGSISAFAVELKEGLGNPKSDPRANELPKKRSVSSFEKLPAVLDMPAELGGPKRPEKKKPPPLPPKRSR